MMRPAPRPCRNRPITAEMKNAVTDIGRPTRPARKGDRCCTDWSQMEV